MSACQPATTHSGSWAVRRWASQFDLDISESILFGLGRTAWYGLTQGDGGAVLLTYHPQRVPRTFLALNVPTEVYHCWRSEPLAPSDLFGGLILEVDPAVLDPEPADRFDEATPHTYCVWPRLMPVTEEESWPFLELQVPGREQTVMVHGSVLARGWRRPVQGLADYTFYIPYTAKVQWTPRVAVRSAIQQWVHQMQQERSPYGQGGLPGLAAFADAVEQGLPVDFERTRRYALTDGGAAGHRDLLAGFFREASELLGETALSDAASMCMECAAIWTALLERATLPNGAAEMLRGIHAMESKVAGILESRVCA